MGFRGRVTFKVQEIVMSKQKRNTKRNLEDLTVTDEQQDQIKGGPNPKSKREVVLLSSATSEESALADLEPNEDVSGGILVGMLVPAVQKVR
jgi:hypothetical protein